MKNKTAINHIKISKKCLWCSVLVILCSASFLLCATIFAVTNEITNNRRLSFKEKINWEVAAESSSATSAHHNDEVFKEFLVNEPDSRHKDCRTAKFLRTLPHVSVIIRFQNESFDVIQQVIDNLLERTPQELLKEIILVDDCSYNTAVLKRIEQRRWEIVRVISRENHCGLARAHNAGMMSATGDILIYLSVEVVKLGQNWLPPLLEPIVFDGKVATQPVIVEHRKVQHYRYLFDWDLTSKPTKIDDKNVSSENYENPLLHGLVFAIKKDSLLSLGFFHKHSNGVSDEAIELSFKVWMCGGKVITIPCSQAKVRHSMHHEAFDDANNLQTLKNRKRIAEIWMDGYKSAFYEMTNAEYSLTGNVAKQKQHRQLLNCKSFEWYIKTVATEMQSNFPFPPLSRASGAIQSISLPNLCISAAPLQANKAITLNSCAKYKRQPDRNQYFVYEFNHRIRSRWSNLCFEAITDNAITDSSAKLALRQCQRKTHNQTIIFDVVR